MRSPIWSFYVTICHWRFKKFGKSGNIPHEIGWTVIGSSGLTKMGDLGIYHGETFVMDMNTGYHMNKPYDIWWCQSFFFREFSWHFFTGKIWVTSGFEVHSAALSGLICCNASELGRFAVPKSILLRFFNKETTDVVVTSNITGQCIQTWQTHMQKLVTSN